MASSRGGRDGGQVGIPARWVSSPDSQSLVIPLGSEAGLVRARHWTRRLFKEVPHGPSSIYRGRPQGACCWPRARLPVGPRPGRHPSLGGAVAGAQGGADVRLITMKDACDAEKLRRGRRRLPPKRRDPVRQVHRPAGQARIMRAWHFAPSGRAREGGPDADGGESRRRGAHVHRSGGIRGRDRSGARRVDGNTEVAPECLALAATTSSSPAGSMPTTRWRNQAPSCTSAAFTRGCGPP